MALPIWRGFHGHLRVRWENAMQVSAILNSRSRFYRGSIHATASALNSNSQSARFNSSRHPESSTRGNARIAAHKSCPNAPVLSTWRLISPENRSGLRSGNCSSFPLIILHRLRAIGPPAMMVCIGDRGFAIVLDGSGQPVRHHQHTSLHASVRKSGAVCVDEMAAGGVLVLVP